MEQCAFEIPTGAKQYQIRFGRGKVIQGKNQKSINPCRGESKAMKN
jgi:hypothetical protein